MGVRTELLETRRETKALAAGSRGHAPDRPPHILHVLLSMGETSAPYNEHCLPASSIREIAICTYFTPTITAPKGLALFKGDNTLPGFFRALRAALSAADYDIIHAHSPHVATFLVLAGLLGYGKLWDRAVYTFHSSYPNYKFTNRVLLILPFAYCRSIVCCSRASRASLPPGMQRLAGDRLSVVQNGIDLDRLDRYIESHPQHDGRRSFTVVSVGRLIAVKNPLALQKAFLQSDDGVSRLVYVGEGPLRETLAGDGSTNSLGKRLLMTGLVSRDAVYGHLLTSDLFISASRVEGLPVAVLEAMACRCPVILSDIGPHREIAAGAEFIPLIPPDDIAAIARQIREFRDKPAAERRSIGEKCRELVRERFSLAKMQEGYRAVYERVMTPAAVRRAT